MSTVTSGDLRGPVSPQLHRPPSRKVRGMEYVKLGVHIWVSVLIMGTLWRVISYHFIASSNDAVQHLGRAMAQQY